MSIPFLDLKAQYKQIKDEVTEAIQNVLDSTAYVLGPSVSNFEEKFAEYIGVKHCVGVNSGTSALHLALLALDIKAGDEIITTPHTFVSTIWAISYVGAIPVFVDINADTYNINTNLLEAKISNKTKAIIPVHLYGQPANMTEIIHIANEFNIPVIEDAAQSHGAEISGLKVGNFGKISCFSFYPGKNLGAYGEGGALVTNDDAIAERCRLLRNHSQPEKYFHNEVGYNYRMDGIQGAVLGVKLKYLDSWNSRRIEIASMYNEAFSNYVNLRIPKVLDNCKHVYHLYELGFESNEKREVMIIKLNEKGIQTGLHYPIPVHLQKAYKYLKYNKGDFPNTENAANTLLSLPIYAEMTNQMVEEVIKVVTENA